MHDRNQTIQAFLDATAAKQPTPGGGSIAALAGALSAAMGEMVLAYSVGKKDLLPFDAQLKASLHTLNRAREMMLQLLEEDQMAYQAMRDLQKLPPDSAERKDKEPATITACIRVPQAIAATALGVLEECDRICPCVNKYLLSDLAVCADLAMATIRCGIYNVRINLPSLNDPQDRQAMEQSSASMLAKGVVIIRELVPRIWQIVEKPK